MRKTRREKEETKKDRNRSRYVEKVSIQCVYCWI
jgi:hypothetical protein